MSARMRQPKTSVIFDYGVDDFASAENVVRQQQKQIGSLFCFKHPVVVHGRNDTIYEAQYVIDHPMLFDLQTIDPVWYTGGNTKYDETVEMLRRTGKWHYQGRFSETHFYDIPEYHDIGENMQVEPDYAIPPHDIGENMQVEPDYAIPPHDADHYTIDKLKEFTAILNPSSIMTKRQFARRFHVFLGRGNRVKASDEERYFRLIGQNNILSTRIKKLNDKTIIVNLEKHFINWYDQNPNKRRPY